MATRTINISGVITPSETDEAYFSSWIDRGVITPESRVTRAIAEAAEAGDDLDIKVNSYGGDVLAGNQMLAAIQDFRGYKCVTIGAFAASMAANLVLQCGCRVECHENSIVLFHSARSCAEGGSGALRDEARMVDQINAPIMSRLIALGVPEEEVREGFSEGRQYTMDADELLKYGIVSKIVKGAAPIPERPDDSEDSKALKLAAYVEDIVSQDDDEDQDPDPDKAEEDKPEETEEAEEDKPEENKPEEDKPEEAEENKPEESEEDEEDDEKKCLRAEYEKRLAGLQSAKDKTIAELHARIDSITKDFTSQIESLKNELAEAQADASASKAASERAAQELAEMGKQLERTRHAHTSLIGAALQVSPEGPRTKQEAKLALAALPPNQRNAYYKSHKDLLD